MKRMLQIAFGLLVLTPFAAAVIYLGRLSETNPSGPSGRPAEDVAVPIGHSTTSESPSLPGSSPIKPPDISTLISPDAPPGGRGPADGPSIVSPQIPEEILPDVRGSTAKRQESQAPATVSQAAGDADPPRAAPSQKLRREGTQIAQLPGRVVRRGAQIFFQPTDGTGPLVLLPNQFLERIEQYESARSRDGKSGTWRLSGRVTEYQGENYLLITGATLGEDASAN
jgi:hypothetical protein